MDHASCTNITMTISRAAGLWGLPILVSMRPLPAFQGRLEAAFGSEIAQTLAKTAKIDNEGENTWVDCRGKLHSLPVELAALVLPQRSGSSKRARTSS